MRRPKAAATVVGLLLVSAGCGGVTAGTSVEVGAPVSTPPTTVDSASVKTQPSDGPVKAVLPKDGAIRPGVGSVQMPATLPDGFAFFTSSANKGVFGEDIYYEVYKKFSTSSETGDATITITRVEGLPSAKQLELVRTTESAIPFGAWARSDTTVAGKEAVTAWGGERNTPREAVLMMWAEGDNAVGEVIATGVPEADVVKVANTATTSNRLEVGNA